MEEEEGVITSGPQSELLVGTEADERFVVGPGAGNDTIVGGTSATGDDHDILDLSGRTLDSVLHVTGSGRGANQDAEGEILFSEIEEVRLGSGDDFVNVTGNYGPLVLDGGEGNDSLQLQNTWITLGDMPFDDTVSGRFRPADGSEPILFGPEHGVLLSSLAGVQRGQVEIVGQNLSGTLAGITYTNFEHIKFNVVCFVRGTRIKTAKGEVAIEDLAVGDRVLTLDNGYQAIRWIGSSRRQAKGDLAPIRIKAGALGNERDLRVSPQHRMLLRGWQAELMFGDTEVLVAAKSLVNDTTILREEGGEVDYFHMLFDRHEIVFAEGAPSESFHPGVEGWKALDAATRAEILELFPALEEKGFAAFGPAARLSLKDFEGRALARQMA